MERDGNNCFVMKLTAKIETRCFIKKQKQKTNKQTKQTKKENILYQFTFSVLMVLISYIKLIHRDRRSKSNLFFLLCLYQTETSIIFPLCVLLCQLQTNPSKMFMTEVTLST